MILTLRVSNRDSLKKTAGTRVNAFGCRTPAYSVAHLTNNSIQNRDDKGCQLACANRLNATLSRPQIENINIISKFVNCTQRLYRKDYWVLRPINFRTPARHAQGPTDFLFISWNFCFFTYVWQLIGAPAAVKAWTIEAYIMHLYSTLHSLHTLTLHQTFTHWKNILKRAHKFKSIFIIKASI